MDKANGSPEWLWFLIAVVYFIFTATIFRKIEKSRAISKIPKNKKLHDMHSAIFFPHFFRKNDDPLRYMRILFSYILFSIRIFFILIPILMLVVIDVIIFPEYFRFLFLL